MRSLAKCLVFLVLAFLALGSLAYAQGTEPVEKRKEPAPTGATKEEVEQLRREVAAQRQTIEALKAMVQRLVEVSQPGAGVPRLVEVGAVQPENMASAAEITQSDKQAAQKKGSDAGLQAGWNGEHFFMKSADGNFQIQPYGYLQLDQRSYRGTTPTPNTFVLRRARVGFQGKLGKHYDFALLLDSADTTPGNVVRDFYFNVNFHPAIQFQFGQFKEPFAQEEMAGAAYLDFVERSLASLLYPSPATFRSPGAMIHGDLIGGAVQYWLGAFNGRGNRVNNTTSTPEGVFRLRFYPFKNSSNAWLKGFAFGGAGTKGRSLRPSDRSLSAAIPTGTFPSFFNTDNINGGIVRANGEFTWIKGPMAIRAEYDQTNQNRTHITATGAASTTNLPGVVAKGYYATATYFLTGEKRPENGQPKPLHPFFATEGGQGIGAWELKFRYSNLQIEDGTQRNRVDQFSTGVNWYPTSLVRYMLDFNVERLKNPFPNPGTPTLLPQTFLSILQRVQVRF